MSAGLQPLIVLQEEVVKGKLDLLLLYKSHFPAVRGMQTIPRTA